VSGTITVQGAAADNSGITRTELHVDGGLVASGVNATFSLSWNTLALADGAHQIMVKAYDTNGNAGQTTVTVLVSNPIILDTQAPAVSFLSPAPNTRISAKTRISISATDNTGVTQVNIYIDGTLVDAGGAPPYLYDWNTRKSTYGSHVITATAWDKAGNRSTASITVLK
jgi:hypothetical protein